MSLEGIRSCEKLLRKVFPYATHLTENYLNWEYNLNPLGKAVGFNVYYEGELVGHQANQPIIAINDKKEVKGVLRLNSAVHPDHRKKGLFSAITEELPRHGKKLGYQFAISVANKNSTPPIRKLGYRLITQLSIKLGFGEIQYSKSPASNYAYARKWSKELLEWRLKNPTRKYTFHYSSDKVIVETNILGINIVLGAFDKDWIPKNKVSAPKNWLPKVWVGLDNSISCKNSKYMNIPPKFRPRPFNLLVKEFSEDFTLNTSNIKFRAIDFDVF